MPHSTSNGSDREYFSGLKALVVDENPDICHIMSGVLEAFRLRSVDTAQTYQEARKKLRLGDVDCVMIDWISEDAEGLQLVHDIRNGSASHANMPIILCTALTDVLHLEEATCAGIDEIIVKPIQPRVVLHKLASAFYGRRTYMVNGDKANKRRSLRWDKPALPKNNDGPEQYSIN